ncbi:MAG: hypothetical protein ACXACI_04920 [Candidatus Hodarchaeales archaeon]|jgi:ribosomal protein L12E/L44/L45/RPP1/RPP2
MLTSIKIGQMKNIRDVFENADMIVAAAAAALAAAAAAATDDLADGVTEAAAAAEADAIDGKSVKIPLDPKKQYLGCLKAPFFLFL